MLEVNSKPVTFGIENNEDANRSNKHLGEFLLSPGSNYNKY